MPEHNRVFLWPAFGGESFQWAHTYSSTPGPHGWAVGDSSSSGTPTYVNNTGGGFTATLDSTSEAEYVYLFQADKLVFDINELKSPVSFIAEVSGVDAVTEIVLGLASAHNATNDTVAANAWFRMQGSASTSAVVVETDDGTNDNDDVATGATLDGVAKEFTIDFSNGKSDVRFFIDNQRVAAGTTFDMSNYSGGLQPYFRVGKASGTGTPSITVHFIDPVPLSLYLS